MLSEPQSQQLREGQGPKRPLLLGLVAAILTVQALLLPILGIVILLSASNSVVVYNGVEVPMGEVRLQLLGIIAAWFAFAAYVGPGLWRGRAMARNVVFAVALVAPIIDFAVNVTYRGGAGLLVAVGYLVVSTLIFGWYLYIKPNVREFFERKSSRLGDAA